MFLAEFCIYNLDQTSSTRPKDIDSEHVLFMLIELDRFQLITECCIQNHSKIIFITWYNKKSWQANWVPFKKTSIKCSFA